MALAPGIVRPARRPLGWIAPGPSPRGGRVVPGAGEDLCHLTGDWRILQRVDGHRWSLDDLVTAWMATRARDEPPARGLDLGCGIGSVLLMLAWRFPAAAVVGVEAQPVSVDLARRSLAWNGCDDRCRVLAGDLRDERILADEAPFDLVTGTPPYLTPGTARESSRVQKGPCNFEHRGGIEAYAVAAARTLAPDGAFVVCEQASQDRRVHDAATAAGLAVTRTLPVVPRAGKAALFAVYEMRARAGARPHEALDPLVVRGGHGARTEAFRALRHTMGLPP
jgi:tRNA1(Val) A37 N6-methylase TrmN6